MEAEARRHNCSWLVPGVGEPCAGYQNLRELVGHSSKAGRVQKRVGDPVQGTQNLMELVGGCLRLKAFVYLSCASACALSQTATMKEECIVPLTDENGNAVDCRRLASELQHLPADLAGARVGPPGC